MKDSKNPFFKSSYASLNAVLDACKKPLNDEGISIMQMIVSVGDKMGVKTSLFHESGEGMESTFVLPDCPDIQKIGSAITYARRYTLQAMVSIPAEDDDGNSALPTPHKSYKAPVIEPPKQAQGTLEKTVDKVLNIDSQQEFDNFYGEWHKVAPKFSEDYRNKVNEAFEVKRKLLDGIK